MVVRRPGSSNDWAVALRYLGGRAGSGRAGVPLRVLRRAFRRLRRPFLLLRFRQPQWGQPHANHIVGVDLSPLDLRCPGFHRHVRVEGALERLSGSYWPPLRSLYGAVLKFCLGLSGASPVM